MIGIICAMPEELEVFLRCAQKSGSSEDGQSLIEIGGCDAVVASSGLGKTRAAMTAASLLERFDCKGLVAKGISDSASDRSHEDFLEGLNEVARRSAEVVRLLLSRLAD